MKKYMRSICSTCRYAAHCCLTIDKGNITSCSEYVHRLDKDNEPLLVVSLEMACDTKRKNEPVLI